MHPSLFLIDFDGTLTLKYDQHGNKLVSIVAILRQNNRLGEDYQEEAQALFDHYYPIEQDPTVSNEEKSVQMEAWRRAHYAVKKKYKLNLSHLQQAIDSGALQMRPGVERLFKAIKASGSYAVIFTASGLGTPAIEMAAKKYGLPFDQYIIVANNNHRDEDGTIGDPIDPIIHSYNKHTITVDSYPEHYQEKLKQYTRGVVLGDSIGDIGMQNFSPLEEVTTIGFATTGLHDTFSEQFDHTFDEHASFDEVLKVLDDT